MFIPDRKGLTGCSWAPSQLKEALAMGGYAALVEPN